MSEIVRVEPASRIRVMLADHVVADTERGYTVYEQGLPPRYYVPRDDVRAELAPGEGAASCPWKGEWRHLDLIAGGQRIANAGWTYETPSPICEPIRDFVAFYPDKLDVQVLARE